MDKDIPKADDSYHSVTFDLQAVLMTPFARDAHIYYKRKLSVYNFTIYNNSSANGHCYLWDETEWGRGANEIVIHSSVLLAQLATLGSPLHKLFCHLCRSESQPVCGSCNASCRTT